MSTFAPRVVLGIMSKANYAKIIIIIGSRLTEHLGLDPLNIALRVYQSNMADGGTWH